MWELWRKQVATKLLPRACCKLKIMLEASLRKDLTFIPRNGVVITGVFPKQGSKSFVCHPLRHDKAGAELEALLLPAQKYSAYLGTNL